MTSSGGLEDLVGGLDRGSLLKRIALGGAALSLPSLAGARGGLRVARRGRARSPPYGPKHPKWKFAFINHVTTNPFFVPTQYGAADAAKMLDVSYTWTRLDEGRRRRDDQRLQRGDQRQGRRHRRLRRRQGRVRGSDPSALWVAVSRSSRTTPTEPARRRRRGRRTSGRTCTCPGSRWASASSSSCRAAKSRSSSPLPGALNIQPRIDGALAAIKTVRGSP